MRLARLGRPLGRPLRARGAGRGGGRTLDSAEELRLFYVAATRARERLLLSGVMPPTGRAELKPATPVTERLMRAFGIADLERGLGRRPCPPPRPHRTWASASTTPRCRCEVNLPSPERAAELARASRQRRAPRRRRPRRRRRSSSRWLPGHPPAPALLLGPGGLRALRLPLLHGAACSGSRRSAHGGGAAPGGGAGARSAAPSTSCSSGRRSGAGSSRRTSWRAADPRGRGARPRRSTASAPWRWCGAGSTRRCARSSGHRGATSLRGPVPGRARRLDPARQDRPARRAARAAPPTVVDFKTDRLDGADPAERAGALRAAAGPLRGRDRAGDRRGGGAGRLRLPRAARASR